MFGYISLHSAILVPNYSFIMLVNNLLFQHYSCQICNQNYASIIGSGLRLMEILIFLAFFRKTNLVISALALLMHMAMKSNKLFPDRL